MKSASQYVQRCAVCRKVRGRTSFRLTKLGRCATCRWCEATNENVIRERRHASARFAQLRSRAARLQRELEAVRKKLARMQSEDHAARIA